MTQLPKTGQTTPRYKSWWVITYNIVENGVLWEGRESKEMGFTADEAVAEFKRMWFPDAVVTSVRPESGSAPATEAKVEQVNREAPVKRRRRLF